MYNHINSLKLYSITQILLYINIYMSNFTEEVCEFVENSFIENFEYNPMIGGNPIAPPIHCDRGKKW